jgi:hypothetical protein
MKVSRRQPSNILSGMSLSIKAYGRDLYCCFSTFASSNLHSSRFTRLSGVFIPRNRCSSTTSRPFFSSNHFPSWELHQIYCCSLISTDLETVLNVLFVSRGHERRKESNQQRYQSPFLPFFGSTVFTKF